MGGEYETMVARLVGLKGMPTVLMLTLLMLAMVMVLTKKV